MEQITISVLRVSLSLVRRKLRQGDDYELTDYNQVIGQLLHPSRLSPLLAIEFDSTIVNVSTSEFRVRISELCEQIDDGSIECVRVWFHGRVSMILAGRSMIDAIDGRVD